MTDIAAADALHLAGDIEAAAAAYRRVIVADPGNVAAWHGLGGARLRAGAYGDAIDALRHAVRLQPDDAAAWGLLAQALYNLGEVEPAVDAFHRAGADASIRASAEANLAIIIPGSASAANADVLALRRAYGRRLAAGISPVERPPRPPSGGKLRIGYVSGYFDKPNWMKPVYGVINHHDREQFEVHLVALGGNPSAAAGYKDHDQDVIWPVGRWGDEQVAQRLVGAGLDVLVDLNAYSAPQWLRLFVRRPAPVQLGWFNSFATSGLDCFDGIVGDDTVIPPTEEDFYSERVLRVPGTCLAFDVLYDVPDVAPPPCIRNGGHLTFGALASAYKLNDLTLGLWAAVLRAAPSARLLVRTPAAEDSSNRDHLRARFAKLGVAPERLELEGGAAHFDFLQSYDRIDVALDTFPYNGGTTTSEALWQGTPVLTYTGDRWVARTSASLLHAAGLEAWIGRDKDDLLVKAGALARDQGTPARLAALRAGMRAQLKASAACDTAGLCRHLEGVYRSLAHRR